MIDKAIKDYVDGELKDIKEFLDIYEDIPILVASINTDVTDIMSAIEKNKSQWEIIKKKQQGIERNLNKLKSYRLMKDSDKKYLNQ